VLTFDPIGGYKHPDHIAIHKATVKAFQLAGDGEFSDGNPPFKPQKLYYHVIPKGWLKLATILLPVFGKDPHRVGKNQDIDLVDLVEAGSFPVNARINFRKVVAQKESAVSCHASQLDGAPLNRGPLRWVQRLFTASDAYMRAYPEPVPGKVEHDLFAGVSDLSSIA
jgi:LmbE family N-acetylglucosaminyl deacetylase